MKIGIILRQAIISGGGERQAIMLAKELLSLGNQVAIYAAVFDREKCFPNDNKGLKILTLPEAVAQGLESKINSASGLRRLSGENELALALANLIEPDTEVLNPNDNWGSHVVYFFKKRCSKTASVLMLNDLDTARWSLFSDPVFGRKKNLLKWPIHYAKDIIERHYLKSQNLIVVLNNRTVGLVKKYLNREAIVVRTGVDLDRFRFIKHGAPDLNRPIQLLSHGIFYVHRRYEDTIKALKILRDRGLNVRLEIIGDYTHKSSAKEYFVRLITLVSDLKLSDSVVFRGRVSDEELLKTYRESHVFVSAAHMQTWGLAVFEAIGSGVPAAISDTIGAAEVLRSGETAVIFKSIDPVSQAEAIERLIKDKSLYERVALNGFEFVKSNLSWRHYAKEMCGYFQMAAKRS